MISTFVKGLMPRRLNEVDMDQYYCQSCMAPATHRASMELEHEGEDITLQVFLCDSDAIRQSKDATLVHFERLPSL